MDIQWYPGHMTKARRQMRQKLKMIDMVIETLDARAPRSSLNPDFDDLFASKMRMYVLNKADLADRTITKQWVSYFKRQGIPPISFSAANDKPAVLKKQIVDAAGDFLRRYRDKGVKKTLRAMIVGIPNVGKSAILNRLLGTRKMKEGNKPGVTKALQWAKIDDYLEIMDSPGMLWPKFDDERTGAAVALIGSVKPDVFNEEELALYLIKMLAESRPGMLAARYKLDDTGEDAYQMLCGISKKRGFLLKGGEYDTERAAKTVLDEFKNGKLGRISLEAPDGR
jgi:ribosome biogenesis GTPase A